MVCIKSIIIEILLVLFELIIVCWLALFPSNANTNTVCCKWPLLNAYEARKLSI